jgi:anti-anti-sigma regulatory factor
MEFAVLVSNIRPSPSVRSPCGTQEEHHRVRLVCSRISSATVIVGRGEVDASNADDVAADVVSHLDDSSLLLLDFSELEFFGISGFFALHHVNVACAQRGIAWSLIPPAAVWRVLRVCDPEGALPVTPTTAAQLATPDHHQESRTHLRLL